MLEGAFAAWTSQELQHYLHNNYNIFAYHYGVNRSGNVKSQDDPRGELKNKV